MNYGARQGNTEIKIGDSNHISEFSWNKIGDSNSISGFISFIINMNQISGPFEIVRRIS